MALSTGVDPLGQRLNRGIGGKSAHPDGPSGIHILGAQSSATRRAERFSKPWLKLQAI